MFSFEKKVEVTFCLKKVITPKSISHFTCIVCSYWRSGGVLEWETHPSPGTGQSSNKAAQPEGRKKVLILDAKTKKQTKSKDPSLPARWTLTQSYSARRTEGRKVGSSHPRPKTKKHTNKQAKSNPPTPRCLLLTPPPTQKCADRVWV